MKDVRKSRYAYNEFVERKSLLDQIYSDSSISKSPFKGVLKVSMIIAFIFVFNTVVVNMNHLANENSLEYTRKALSLLPNYSTCWLHKWNTDSHYGLSLISGYICKQYLVSWLMQCILKSLANTERSPIHTNAMGRIRLWIGSFPLHTIPHLPLRVSISVCSSTFQCVAVDQSFYVFPSHHPLLQSKFSS